MFKTVTNVKQQRFVKGTGSIIKHIHKQIKEHYQNLCYHRLHNVIKFDKLFVYIFILGHTCEGKVKL